jgi:hypothetical protein
MGIIQLMMSLSYIVGGILIFRIKDEEKVLDIIGFPLISMVICGIIMFIWLFVCNQEEFKLNWIGWLPNTILLSIPFILCLIISISTNLHAIGRFRRVSKHHSERLSIVMEDERWQGLAKDIVGMWRLYRKQVNSYTAACKKLGKRWHRWKYHIKSGKFTMRLSTRLSSLPYTDSVRLRIHRQHCLILSIEEINERGKVIYANLNYLPDWATFPTIIEQATERLHDQTEILQDKLNDKIYQQHQDKQGFKDYVSSLADVFIDKS